MICCAHVCVCAYPVRLRCLNNSNSNTVLSFMMLKYSWSEVISQSLICFDFARTANPFVFVWIREGVVGGFETYMPTCLFKEVWRESKEGQQFSGTGCADVVQEAARVLKPGGVLAITDNNPKSPVIQGLPPALFTLMKSTVGPFSTSCSLVIIPIFSRQILDNAIRFFVGRGAH